MSHDEAVVIVGAGQAGVQAAESLRAGGWPGPVVMIGDERPIHRPPLSKAWLAGETDAAQLEMRSPEALARKGIELRAGLRVASLDRAQRTVHLDDGSRLGYRGLVLATGARSRELGLPGGDAVNVKSLRTRADADAIAAALADCSQRALPVVVIGGGFIGLEVAATARKKGLAVTVVEAAPRLLSRVLGERLSSWFAALHREHGVEVVLGAGVSSIEVEGGRAVAVLGADGQRWPAGLVVMGVGAVANDELARAAGLPCDRGIVVDDCSRTADPLVVAAGDCATRQLADGTRVRLESVHNAIEQGRSAASALLGSPRPFAGAPWFWSDQHGRRLQIAGLAAGADDERLRGDPASRSFSIWHFAGRRLVAVDTIDNAREHLVARRMLDAGRLPTPEQVSDPTFDLSSLLAH